MCVHLRVEAREESFALKGGGTKPSSLVSRDQRASAPADSARDRRLLGRDIRFVPFKLFYPHKFDSPFLFVFRGGEKDPL